MINNFSRIFDFKDWPNRKIPLVAAGVYSIWHESRLIYCGMAGPEIEKAIFQNKKKYGLYSRLHSHASGRLGGDQFCVYVANRIIIPDLKEIDLQKFRSGELTLDLLAREYIQEYLSYQYCVLESSKETRELEIAARRGVVFNERPFLNPYN